MKKALGMLLLGIAVSFYLFPVRFIGMPESLNTKQIIGVLGIIYFVFRSIREGEVKMSKDVLIAALIACVFSVWCFFCEVDNGTSDGSYSQYIVSFAVWLGAAYGVCSILRSLHERVSLRILTNYLAVVCVVQCILAILIDNIPSMKLLVDSYVFQDQDFLNEVDRLYGIGASLDPAGVRFSIVLFAMAHIMSTDTKIRSNQWALFIYMVMFGFISIVGNMISRTTTVGAIIGIVYMVAYFLWKSRDAVISRKMLANVAVVLGTVLLAVGISVLLYRTDVSVRHNLRFAFEGFFNLVEEGRFSTDSTDKLNAIMWVWPNNFHDWMIGTGLFNDFIYGTDIGYCRFTLYCGLIGLVIFSGFFVYNGFAVMRRFNDFSLAAIILIAMTFIIWVKVATDIFFFFALLYCLDHDKEKPQSDTAV